MLRSICILSALVVIVVVGGGVGVVCMTGPFASPPPATAAVEESPFGLARIEQVHGRLGKRLGTIVTVDAEIIRGADIDSKRYRSLYLLKVTHVDGKPLPAAPFFRFDMYSFAPVGQIAKDGFELYERKHGMRPGALDSNTLRELETGYVGSKHRFQVFETGQFVGSPDEVQEIIGAFADVDFHFATSLMLLSEK